MNTKDTIKILEIEIEEAVKFAEMVDKTRDELYRAGSDYLRSRLPHGHEFIDLSEKIKIKKELLELCVEESIEIGKKYYLMPDIYLNFGMFRGELQAFYYIENCDYIYNHFICSWSGINEWITNLIDDKYALYTGNSKYSYAFGTETIKDKMGILIDEKYKNPLKLTVIKSLISFTVGESLIKNLIVKEISSTLEVLKTSYNDD